MLYYKKVLHKHNYYRVSKIWRFDIIKIIAEK
jgi:hypothetical protein